MNLNNRKIISAQNRRKYALYIGIAQNRRKPPPFFNVVYVNGLAYCKVWAPILICARYIHIYYLYYIGKILWIGEISMLKLNKILMDAVALYIGGGQIDRNVALYIGKTLWY